MKVYIIKVYGWCEDEYIPKVVCVVDSIQKADSKVCELTDNNSFIWCEIEEFEVQ